MRRSHAVVTALCLIGGALAIAPGGTVQALAGPPGALTTLEAYRSASAAPNGGKNAVVPVASSTSGAMTEGVLGLSLSQGEGEVRIDRVEYGSRAARAGLEEGDVILSINRRPVFTPAEVVARVSIDRFPLLLMVRRGNIRHLITVR